jgi:hypothetical protein
MDFTGFRHLVLRTRLRVQRIAKISLDQERPFPIDSAPSEFVFYAVKGACKLALIKVPFFGHIHTDRRRKTLKGVESKEAHPVETKLPGGQLGVQERVTLEHAKFVVVAMLRRLCHHGPPQTSTNHIGQLATD